MEDAGPIPGPSGVERREWIAARTWAGLAARTARARQSSGGDRAVLEAHRRVVREQQRQRAVREVRGKVMNERNFVHIGHIKDVSAVLRLLDELREDLNDAQAPTSTIETVDDLRIEARKPKPSKDITNHLMEKLADRGLGEQMKELEKAFDALY